MDTLTFIQTCISEVAKYENYEPSEVYVVWQCKTLQNHKALLSSSLVNGLYYEVTYNGNTQEFYFDVYKKQSNKTFYNV